MFLEPLIFMVILLAQSNYLDFFFIEPVLKLQFFLTQYPSTTSCVGFEHESMDIYAIYLYIFVLSLGTEKCRTQWPY